MQREPIRASNMKVCHTLICVVFLSLWDGNTACLHSDTSVYTRTEGENIRASCHFDFSLSGKHKIFCKGECEEKDILIETYEDRAQRGRYSIQYKHLDPQPSIISMDVSISNLTKSDSGWYRCKVDRSTDSYDDFELRVEDAPTASKPKWKTTTKAPFTPSVPSASKPTTTQSLSSSSGSSTPSSSLPETPILSEQRQSAQAPGQGVLQYVSLTVVVMIIVLSAAVLIFCRKRASEAKEPTVEYVHFNEEEDRQSTSPPEEISTVYTHSSQFSGEHFQKVPLL
ncbi:uncharacterized protein LOC127376932 isoform X2 [Dicentrarchus labrax]|uniref:uncharacterized protein LOC127376932 isoform X2 n=1 Tax=Dicentrarchus labrax TaxID=13489 RepID=UPI0021F5E95C|nr:uncharacterized protein LOC127376932 isoform X2 [Dicentrarchus labrax]